jgi:hypothetical protein
MGSYLELTSLIYKTLSQLSQICGAMTFTSIAFIRATFSQPTFGRTKYHGTFAVPLHVFLIVQQNSNWLYVILPNVAAPSLE